MIDPDPSAPERDVAQSPQRADAVTFWRRTAWLLLLTAAGFSGLVATWLPCLEPVSIGLATASVPLVVLWAYRVLVWR